MLFQKNNMLQYMNIWGWAELEPQHFVWARPKDYSNTPWDCTVQKIYMNLIGRLLFLQYFIGMEFLYVQECKSYDGVVRELHESVDIEIDLYRLRLVLGTYVSMITSESGRRHTARPGQ